MKAQWNPYIVVLVFCLFTACNNGKMSEQKKDTSFEYFTDSDTILNITDSKRNIIDSLVEQMQRNLNKVEIDSQTLYVVEGDLLMDEDELYYYCVNRVISNLTDSSIHPLKMDHHEFTVSTLNGEPEIWPTGYVIKYAVIRKSFDTKELYDSVVSFMKAATRSWMDACNVQFQYLPEYDNAEVGGIPQAPLTFYVRQFNSRAAFIAQAFFPGDSPMRRKLCIDPSFFNPNLNVSKIGILRHELGHVIGARHEHIWSSENDCQGERIFDGIRGARQVTKYDPYSVMHYLCGNVGSRILELTTFDIEGAQRFYGKK